MEECKIETAKELRKHAKELIARAEELEKPSFLQSHWCIYDKQLAKPYLYVVRLDSIEKAGENHSIKITGKLLDKTGCAVHGESFAFYGDVYELRYTAHCK